MRGVFAALLAVWSDLRLWKLIAVNFYKFSLLFNILWGRQREDKLFMDQSIKLLLMASPVWLNFLLFKSDAKEDKNLNILFTHPWISFKLCLLCSFLRKPKRQFKYIKSYTMSKINIMTRLNWSHFDIKQTFIYWFFHFSWIHLYPETIKTWLAQRFKSWKEN